MIFDMNKFQYIDHTLKSGAREIIALAKYNGKIYRGSAKCHPEDIFVPEIGREIAARRCDLAIRRARLKDRITYEGGIYKKWNEIEKATHIATDKVIKAENELYEAQAQYEKYFNWLENK